MEMTLLPGEKLAKLNMPDVAVKSIVEPFAVNVSAPIPTALLDPSLAPAPFAIVPPFNVIVAALLIRSLLVVALEFDSNSVPPEFTMTLVVPARRGVVDPALSSDRIPPLMVVVPV